ncbi:MAG: outer membrane protein assembly factor BamB [Pseudomonadota bacterium]
MNDRLMPRIAATLVLTVTLSACGIFGSKEEKELPPAELLPITETLNVKQRWSAKVGADASELRLGLSPVSDGVRVYAASNDGQVHALSLDKGEKIWTIKLKLSLTAGPGFGDGRIVVASNDGDIVTLDAATGAEVWRRRIDAEVLARPAIGGERVVVRTADGRLIGLNGATGEDEWLIEEEVPRLSLRGTSAPVIAANAVVCGFDNGRIMTVDLLDGTVRWDQMLRAPSGRTDLERLVDIDGAIAVVGRDLYVTGFQGIVAAIALESGQLLWNREVSSYHGPGVDWTQTYVATDDGDLVALSRTTGVEQWRNTQLKRRQLSAPVTFGDAVVVGDLEGYLHWMDAQNGEFRARRRVGKGRVSGALHAQGELLLVQSESGVVAAFEVVGDDS